MELPGGVANIVQRMKDYAVTLRTSMSDEEATKFLEKNAQLIQDRMVESGWEAIQHLLFEEGL